MNDAFGSTLPQANLATIGHVGHGKSTLTAAITKVLAETGGAAITPYGSISAPSEARELSVLTRVARLEYDSQKRHYSHADCHRHIDYVKNMIVLSSRLDGAILVVSATEGPMPETYEQLRLANQLGVPAIVVYLNKCDAVDESLIEFVELDVRRLLSECGYAGEDATVVKGSALRALEGDNGPFGTASIQELIAAVDAHVPERQNPGTLPLLMQIDAVSSMANYGTVVEGVVERGIIRREAAVDIVGLRAPKRKTCSAILYFRKPMDEGRPGERITVALRDTGPHDVERGQVLCAPDSATTHTQCRVAAYILAQDEGGRRTPFYRGYAPRCLFRSIDIAARVELPPTCEMVTPGSTVNLDIKLETPVAMEAGLRIALMEGGRTVGFARISAMLD